MTRPGGRASLPRALRAGELAPLAALTSRSRRADWWRRVARRVLAVTLALVSLALVMSRLTPPDVAGDTPNRPAGPAPTAEAPAGPDAPGSPDGTDGAVRDATRTGARSVPAGAIGVSLPAVDPATLTRLKAGDRVDVYVVGVRRPVASGARVLDVTRVSPEVAGESPSPLYDPSAPPRPTVFVAVTPAEVGPIAAGQGSSQAGGFFFALHPRNPPAPDPVP